MRDFRQFKVWERAHNLALAVYRVTATFPREEMYGLTSQMRRCSSSIPANIAEGCGRESDIDFARFLQIAAGSASELEYHLLLAHDLGFLNTEDYTCLTTQVEEVKRMLFSFGGHLRSRQSQSGRRVARDSPSDESLYLTSDT